MSEQVVLKLNSITREFNYFLNFLQLKEKLKPTDIKKFVTNEFFLYDRVHKMLYLISCFFHDPLFISYLYLKIYLRKSNYEVKRYLLINDKQLKKLNKKFLQKDFQIKLKSF